MQTLYDRLAVSRNAPPEVIRAAYRALSQRHHPDRNPGDASAAKAMQLINEAYAVLSDARRKSAYDASLSSPVPSSTAPREKPTVGTQARRLAPSAPYSRRRKVALTLLLFVPLFGAGVGLWHASQQTRPVVSNPLIPAVEWRIHGVDSRPERAEARASVPVPDAVPGVQNPRADPSPTAPRPAPTVDAATRPPDTLAAQRSHPALPIVVDPNGRPWPLGAAYVAGLPQTNVDGLSAVLLDNERNPAPVFVTLVALDGDRAEPVRHVHVPPMGAFRVESIRPGRYEVQHRNLVTGALTRSEVFELRQIDGRYGTRATERTVALDPWTAAMAPVAGKAF